MIYDSPTDYDAPLDYNAQEPPPPRIFARGVIGR